MAGMSDYLENHLIDYIFRGISYSTTNFYIALLTVGAVDSDTGTNLTTGSGGTGVEVSASGTAYTRYNLNPSNINWVNTQNSGTGVSSGTSGTTSNSTVITFPTATASWGTIVGVAICDASTNGNMLFYGTLTTPKSISIGDNFQFDVSQLLVSFS